MKEQINESIRSLVESARQGHIILNDSVSLHFPGLLDSVYGASQFNPVWSENQRWLDRKDTLLNFIRHARQFGLFPSDYHFGTLSFIDRVFLADTVASKNASFWAMADVLLTDAYFTVVKHVKQGRLQYDSVTLRTDSVLHTSFYIKTFEDGVMSGRFSEVIDSLEPRYPGYDSLKTYLKGFLSRAHFKPFTRLSYPYTDSVQFFNALDRRLRELGLLSPEKPVADSATIAHALKKYQERNNFKVTGRVSDPLIDKFNDTDWERFKRISINMDRYKLLPDTLPRTYAWVNLPSFMLKVYSEDTLVFQSRVVVGGPVTRTPLLTSEISNFITYPQWTVPYSIIFKEMLPKIRENVDYLQKENLMVVDNNDSVLDPHNINWKKLNKEHFPYLIKQREGDDNSLGVIKFNFRNKYSVYMHDTNVRSLFSKSSRALSHGCVRVKEWQKLADFLVREDTVKHPPDTLRAWIKRQEKHIVTGFPKLPVYIRYFTCEGKDGKIRFYDDIYETDRYLIEKYFAGKNVE
jgi:murein L,D-transpeptidase YcbB/YkuD